jgi:DNA adenine methylase
LKVATSSGPARPFLKWVGGKRQLLRAIEAHIPKTLRGTYHEPFVGGGALFFHLVPKRARLSDTNQRLIRAYRGIQTSCEEVIDLLREHQSKHTKHKRTYFHAQRKRDIDREQSDAAVAAWFVYLNRTAYNGLYRVNSKNQFNVPFGRYEKPAIVDADRLRACAHALEQTELAYEDFEAVLKHAKSGDFVYFDPPYVPLSDTAKFTSYTRQGFGPSDQERLRDAALALKRRKVRVLISNSDSLAVRELYAKGFKLQEVSARRQVNSKVSGRGHIGELLIY